MSRSGSSSKLAAWLALLALVMLLFAPFISKQLVAHGLMAMPMSRLSDHPGPMPAMQKMDGMAESDPCVMSHLTPGASTHSVNADAMQDMACGYCQLMIHLPFVLLCFVVQLLLLFVLLLFAPLLRCCEDPLERVWLRQPARGPPFFISARH